MNHDRGHDLRSARLPHYGSSRQSMIAALARGLGWFSIGLGAAQLAMPRLMARATGLPRREELMQAYGAREVLTGVAILVMPDPRIPIWGRIAGDALDTATLAFGVARGGHAGRKAALALVALAPVVLADLACAKALGARARRKRDSVDYSSRIGMRLPVEQASGRPNDRGNDRANDHPGRGLPQARTAGDEPVRPGLQRGWPGAAASLGPAKTSSPAPAAASHQPDLSTSD